MAVSNYNVGDWIRVKSHRAGQYPDCVEVNTVVQIVHMDSDGDIHVNKKGSTTDRCTLYPDEVELSTKGGKTIMTKLNSMMKRLLDKDTQALVKAGLVNGDLEMTDEGQRALTAILFTQNKDALVAEAKEIIEEAEKKKE